MQLKIHEKLIDTNRIIRISQISRYRVEVINM